MSTAHPTRRTFLKIASLGFAGLTLPFSFRSLASSKQNSTFLVYIGTYTDAKSEGIYLHKLDASTGTLTPVSVTKGTESPSYLVIDQQKKFLYAVNETHNYEGKKSGAVSAFSINPKTGALSFLNKQASLGGAPCFISLDKTGKNALVANYSGGNITVFPIQPSGHLGPSSDMEKHTGSSVNTKRQEKPHAHCVIVDPTNNYAFAADLGIDKVVSYRFDSQTGKLKPNPEGTVSTKAGAGPRHFIFHPNEQYAYVINELNSTITSYGYDKSKGTLKEQKTLSTLPKDFTGENFCADIHISPNGKFLYGSNRGHNSIAVFTINEQSGELTPVEHVSTQGKWPRNFALDPGGQLLLVANQESNSIVSFKVDGQTGKLSPTGHQIEVPSPVCIHIIPAFS